MQGQGTPRVAGLPPPGMAPYYGAPYGYPPRGPMPMQPPPMGYPPELHPHFMPRGPFPPGMSSVILVVLCMYINILVQDILLGLI
jgi:hypothetical protein